ASSGFTAKRRAPCRWPYGHHGHSGGDPDPSGVRRTDPRSTPLPQHPGQAGPSHDARRLGHRGHTPARPTPGHSPAAGIPANTIASVLAASDKRPSLNTLDPKTVVVIDEAGVVPVRQMDKLLALIQPTGAKVMLLGDTAQTKAIEAGRAFAMLQ